MKWISGRGLELLAQSMLFPCHSVLIDCGALDLMIKNRLHVLKYLHSISVIEVFQPQARHRVVAGTYFGRIAVSPGLG